MLRFEMLWFDNPQTVEELKKQYKKLAFEHHPDRGGNAEHMKQINAEYGIVFERLKNIHSTSDGKTYTARLDQSSPSDEIGKTVTILYDPDDPSIVHGGKGIGIYCMVLGAAILAFVIFSAIKNQQSQKELQEYRESRGQTGYAPSVQGEERELYF